MAFHCMALATSLVGILYARKGRTFRFSYGYERYEVLATFSNALFLIFSCLFVMVGAVHRLFSPRPFGSPSPHILEFGVFGLVLNILGVTLVGPRATTAEELLRLRQVAFSAAVGLVPPQGPTRQSSSNTSSGGGNGAEHDSAAARSRAIAGAASSSGSATGARAGNFGAIYLHFFTDALSSFAVIVSSLMVKLWGWTIVRAATIPTTSLCLMAVSRSGRCTLSSEHLSWALIQHTLSCIAFCVQADTLQSIMVASLTLYLAVPIFHATGMVLLQTTPPHLRATLTKCVQLPHRSSALL